MSVNTKIKKMKALIFTNWHAMRWIRLAIAFFLVQQAIQYQQVLFVFMALFFLVQSLFNMGCGLNGCAIPNPKNK